MTILYWTLTAFLIDLIIGDPRSLPHPVRAIGATAKIVESWIRKKLGDSFRHGVLTNLSILGITALVYIFISSLLHEFSSVAYHAFNIYIIFSCISTKDLMDHAKRVYLVLIMDDIVEARKRVGYIVGRDTQDLNKEQIIKATVESVSENTVDGVTAPLIYAILFGPLGALMYRTVNTLDSMFGYKNEKYINFGKFSARLDDVFNYIPARLTGPLISFGSLLLGKSIISSLRILFRDARNHPSPNSGWSMSATSGALGLQLGGPTKYFGKMVNKPTMGEELKQAEAQDILDANRLMFTASCITLVLGFVVKSLFI